jgi:serine protease Do
VTSVSSNAYLTDNVYKLLATDVKGASGGSGVLVDMDGSVIGVIDQNLSPDGGETVTALAVSGIKPLIETLSNNTEIPYIGITGQEVSDTIAQQTGMPAGVLVTNVADDSPAMLSGLKTYDVITEISGKTITTFRDYHNLLYSLHPGDVVTVTAMRKGAEGYTAVSFNVSIGSR